MWLFGGGFALGVECGAVGDEEEVGACGLYHFDASPVGVPSLAVELEVDYGAVKHLALLVFLVRVDTEFDGERL